MGVLLLISVPVVLYLFRKYREYKWGYYSDNKILKDKVFIVTGGNSGLGKETVKELASRDATVIMACRDLQKTENVINEIRGRVKSGKLIPLELDLSSFASIKKFSEVVKNEFLQVHVLINNAGVSIKPDMDRTLTSDGFEINFGTNHLGHFLLTNLLLEKLEKSTPSRIVIVSSKLHERGKIDFNNLQGEKNSVPRNITNPAYNNSKLANIYFCRELAKRMPTGMETYAVCPGFCYTGLFRHEKIKWFQYLVFAPIAYFFMRSAHQGCQTILYCALSNDVCGKSGKIFRDCKLYNSSFKFEDDVQRQLWETSESLTHLK